MPSTILSTTRRVTTLFLQSIPPQIEHFDAYCYAVVKRKPGLNLNDKWGYNVRLDPCVFDWTRKTITISIPLNINTGITSFDDLDQDFFEELEATFLAMMMGVLP